MKDDNVQFRVDYESVERRPFGNTIIRVSVLVDGEELNPRMVIGQTYPAGTTRTQIRARLMATYSKEMDKRNKELSKVVVGDIL